jgi:deoxyribonuclease-4
MKIGAHVSAAGGLSKAIDRAEIIGAESIQLFASSPRGWSFKEISDSEINLFREKIKVTNISPVFLHGIYLVNVGGKPELLHKSIGSLVTHMDAADKIGASGVIFHGGSHKGVGFEGVIDQCVKALKEVLDNTSPNVWLVIENSAGMGSHIGASFQEIGRLIKAIDNERMKVCIDTEHAFAAGYNLADPVAIDQVMEEFDREIGLAKLVAVHANDAKVGFGSGVDRHENIGEGHIGVKGFETIMAYPAYRDIPFILEVPGFDGKGPDKINVDLLKSIRKKTWK